MPSIGLESRQMHHASTQAEPGVLPIGMVCQPTRQRVGPMEGEHSTTRRHRVQPAREPGLGAGRLVAERQCPVDLDGRPGLRVCGLVLASLRLNTSERHASLLGLDDADRLTVHVQHVVGWAGRGRHLTNGNALSRSHRHRLEVLQHPAARRQLLIDVPTSQLLGRHVLAHNVPELATGTPHTSDHRTILNGIAEEAHDRSWAPVPLPEQRWPDVLSQSNSYRLLGRSVKVEVHQIVLEACGRRGVPARGTSGRRTCCTWLDHSATCDGDGSARAHRLGHPRCPD